MTNVAGQRIEPAAEAASPLTEIQGVEKGLAHRQAAVRGAAAADLAIWPRGHGDGGWPIRLFT
jgi:hypothetical protein